MKEHLIELAERSAAYAGFNLLLFEPFPGSNDQQYRFDAALISNLGGGGRIVYRHLDAEERKRGGISNGVDGRGGETWPKVLEAKRCLQHVLEQDIAASGAELDARLVNSMFQILAYAP